MHRRCSGIRWVRGGGGGGGGGTYPEELKRGCLSPLLGNPSRLRIEQCRCSQCSSVDCVCVCRGGGGGEVRGPARWGKTLGCIRDTTTFILSFPDPPPPPPPPCGTVPVAHGETPRLTNFTLTSRRRGIR